MKMNLRNGPKTSESNPQHMDEEKDIKEDINEGSPELQEGIHLESQMTSPSESVPHGRDGIGCPQFYPPPTATHHDVIKDPELFIATLDNFLAAIGTRLTVPKVGDKEIDLHVFYREVTARGGLEQVIRSASWKEVCDALKLQRALNNRSYALRKHYVNLLFHYEQVYFFRVEGQLLSPPVPLPAPIPVLKSKEPSSPYEVPLEMRSLLKKKKRKLDPVQVFGVDPAASVGAVATGAICGKFDEGYFVTVVVGTEKLSGVLYHISPRKKAQQFASVPSLLDGIGTEGTTTGLEIQLYGKKKERVQKKDPNGPKRTRTGYNIYFKEQRARLKELYPGSKGLGKKVIDMWNKLPEEEKSYYNALGNVERERYLAEYREKMKVQQSQGNDGITNGSVGSAPVAEVDRDAYYVSHDYHVSLDVESEVQTGHSTVHNSVREQVYHGYHANESLVESEIPGAHLVSEQTYEMQDDEGDFPQEHASEEEEDDNEAEEAYEEEEDETIYRNADKILEQEEEEEQEQEQEQEYGGKYQSYDVPEQAYLADDAATAAIAKHAYYGSDHTYPYVPDGSQGSTHGTSLDHSPYGGRDNGQVIYNTRVIQHGRPDISVDNVVSQHLYSHDRYGYSPARPGALGLSLPPEQATFSRQEEPNTYMGPPLQHHQNQGVPPSIQTRHQPPSELGYRDRYPYHIQMPQTHMYARPSPPPPPPPHGYMPRFPHPSYNMQWSDAEAFQHAHGGYVPQLHHPQAVVPDVAAVRPASHAYQAQDGGQTKL